MTRQAAPSPRLSAKGNDPREHGEDRGILAGGGPGWDVEEREVSMRFLPLFLIPLIAAGAFRRDAGVPKSADRRGHAPGTEVSSIIEEGNVAAPKASRGTITVALRVDAEERERQLAQ